MIPAAQEWPVSNAALLGYRPQLKYESHNAPRPNPTDLGIRRAKRDLGYVVN
jgi:hypothetical protein